MIIRQTESAAVDSRNAASIRVLEKCGFMPLRREPAELHGAKTEDFIYSTTPRP
jgi:RimJ/RimL family protein N-acetyltransferase